MSSTNLSQMNIIRADDKHADTFDLGGALWKIQIPGSETGDQFSLVESICPPGIGGPLHRHIRADQAIYVLEGELEILADSKSLFFTKGETCLIRRGAPHREINSSRSETCSYTRRPACVFVTAAGFRPRIVLESDRTQAVLAMVAAENGIGMFTETITRLIDRGVVFRPLNTRKAVLQHTLVWQADKNSEALLAFQKILRNRRTTSR